jgi:hypothetical protein
MQLIRTIATFAILMMSVAEAQAVAFDAMNVGCSWDVRHSDGTTRTSTFLGRIDGKFTVETRPKDQPNTTINVIQYNDDGYMTLRTWSQTEWEKFIPFSCFDVVGECSYQYQRADGLSVRIHSSVTVLDQGYLSEARPEGGDSYPDEQFDFGPFNLTLYTRASNYSTELVGFNNCVSLSS